MTLNLKDLIEYLEITDLRLSELKKQVLVSFGDHVSMQALLREQCADEDETGCISCEDDGECAILTGVIRLDLHNSGISPLEKNNQSDKSNREIAVAEFESSKRHLHVKSRTWNCVIAMVLLSMTLEAEGKKFLALREYKEAHDVLNKHYLKIHANEYNEKAVFLEQHLTEKITALSISRLAPPPPAADVPPAEESFTPAPLFTNTKDYLALFSIPIYGAVEAGAEGEFLLENPAEPFTMVDEIELHGKKYYVHNLHGTSATDSQINVNVDRSHGWLKVHGLSMNAWNLPFDEDDYVLFYCADKASHMDFVIASSADPSTNASFIVKRYDDHGKLLLSKSHDSSRSYDSIKLDLNHKICGIVIAVAKPIK